MDACASVHHMLHASSSQLVSLLSVKPGVDLGSDGMMRDQPTLNAPQPYILWQMRNSTLRIMMHSPRQVCMVWFKTCLQWLDGAREFWTNVIRCIDGKLWSSWWRNATFQSFASKNWTCFYSLKTWRSESHNLVDYVKHSSLHSWFIFCHTLKHLKFEAYSILENFTFKILHMAPLLTCTITPRTRIWSYFLLELWQRCYNLT